MIFFLLPDGVNINEDFFGDKYMHLLNEKQSHEPKVPVCCKPLGGSVGVF